MKSCVFLLALLQSLYCSGLPVYNSEMSVMADRGLAAVLSEVNSVYAGTHLYRVTKGSVTRVIPVAMNHAGHATYDLLLSFGVKESACLKSSREDPQGCAFRPGFFLPSYSCVSRVRVSALSAQVVSLRCGHGSSSSSSESSEEIFYRGRQHVNIPSLVNRDPPAPQTPLPAVPASPGRFVLKQDVPASPDRFVLKQDVPASPDRFALKQDVPVRSVVRPDVEVTMPRGDVFTNYLV